MHDFRERTVYITGGAQGIGLATAEMFAALGAQVAVSDFSSDALEASANSAASVARIQADLSTAEGVASANEAVEAWAGGAPDIIVNNVGQGSSHDFRTATDEDWDYSFRLNLLSHVRTIRHFIDRMPPDAAIVNVASDLAKQPEAVPVEYGAMKAALLHLTKNLALHHAPVRINAVLPGPVWTPLWTRPGGLIDQLSVTYQTDADSAVSRYLEERHLPLGIADPSDVAQLIVFLASPLASRITGAAVDLGGTNRGLL